LFICLFREHDEGYGSPALKTISEKLCGGIVSRFMLEENQVVLALLQQRFSLFRGTRVIKFCRQNIPVPFEDLADEKKILLLVPYQQNV